MELPRPVEFTASFTDAIVDALDECYRRVGRMRRPRLGLDERWAGLTIAMLAGPAFAKSFRVWDDVVVRPAGLVYELVKGQHEMRTNKLGRTADQSVESSFPRPSRAVAAMAAANQLQPTLGLAGIDQEIEKRLLVALPAPTRWVIGHMGTAGIGLQAVYFCAPWRSYDNAITEWRGWIAIYRADGMSGDSLPPPLPDDSLPPALEIQPAPLALLDHPNDVKDRDAG